MRDIDSSMGKVQWHVKVIRQEVGRSHFGGYGSHTVYGSRLLLFTVTLFSGLQRHPIQTRMTDGLTVAGWVLFNNLQSEWMNEVANCSADFYNVNNLQTYRALQFIYDFYIFFICSLLPCKICKKPIKLLLLLRKTLLRKFKMFVQGHWASKYQSCDSNSGFRSSTVIFHGII